MISGIRVSQYSSRHTQRGISLLELALSVVILGIVGILLTRWYATSRLEHELVLSRSALQRADDALLAFAAIEHRLPCPARDSDGEEDCTGDVSGKLPWRTIGLPDARAAGLNYAVQRRSNPASPQLDADLAASIDRTRPLKILQTASGPAAYATATGYINGLDFCQGLRVSMRLPMDSNHVHTPAGNVAYAISSRHPAMGPSADAGLPIALPSPRAPVSADAPHETIVVGADQLWQRLNCSAALAAVNYSHFNIAAAAGAQVQSIVDLEEQLRILVKMGEANSASAAAATAQATTGLLSATTGLLFAKADMSRDIANPELKGADLPWDITGLGLSIAAEVEAALVTAAAIAFNVYVDSAKDRARDHYAEIRHAQNGLTARSKQMATCLYAAAVAADARGMNPSNAVAQPAIPDCSPR